MNAEVIYLNKMSNKQKRISKIWEPLHSEWFESQLNWANALFGNMLTIYFYKNILQHIALWSNFEGSS